MFLWNDREKFFTHVRDVCQSGYKVSIDKVLGHLSKSGGVKHDNIRSLFFGDYLLAERVYDEVTDIRELHKKMEQSVTHFLLLLSVNFCHFCLGSGAVRTSPTCFPGWRS